MSNTPMISEEIYVLQRRCYNSDEFKERVIKTVPKEKWENRKAAQTDQAAANNAQNQPASRKLTPEEAGALVRDRLANRPVIVWRYRNGKWNKRFIITLAVMIVALIAALYFISRAY